MTGIESLKKLASDTIAFAEAAKAMAAKAVEADKMHKAASAAVKEEKPLSEEKLAKAASAVASLYGDRAAVNADTLTKVWSTNHNTMVDSILKLASDRIAEKVKEPEMVRVKKQASVSAAPKTPRGASHRDAFDEIFGIVRK